MGLFSTEKIHQPAMDARKVKDGPLLRYKHGFLGGGKWKSVHAILYSDSTFSWYDDKHDGKPVGSILLKDVVPYMCVGLMTDRMPIRRPTLPSGASVHHLVGIGMDPRAEKVHWFLFGSDSDLEAWFQEIIKTLPKPPTPPPQLQPQDGVKSPDVNNPPPVGFVNPPPPPYSGGGQPGVYPQPNNYPSPPSGAAYPAGGSYPAGGYRPQQPYYPPSGGPTTVIIDRTGTAGGGGGYSSGPGFGTGMLGGALGGALLGYGLGSMFSGPHLGGGFGGGGWGGHGFGGGYYSDNDTTVNNYYNTTNNDTTNVTNDNNGGYNSPQDQPYDQNQGIDYNDFGNDDAGYDGGGFDGGYDDVGGGGFDSGDIGGGGDFSGGDFGDF